MTKEELLAKYKEWELKTSAYKMALAIIGIDKQTVAPEGGAPYRDKRTAVLAGELFSLQMDPENIEVLRELMKMDLDGDTAKAVKMNYDEIMKTVAVPKDEFVAYQNLTNEAYGAWLDAKNRSDYAAFEPYLEKLIEGTRKMYEYRDSDLSLYDRMLDDYEPGMTQEKYDVFFDRLKERIVPLIRRVTEAQKIDTSFLHRNYPVEEQKKFMDELLQYLRFDPYWGYLNETEHPFTSGTCENDCRTTTKYLPDNVASAILSTVHEVGHATYGHQTAPEYDGTILAEAISMGMHESQSRLCENYLGRSKPFWEANYPRLQKHFPEQLGDVSLDAFVAAINAAEPSLIRTEADELTYPLHILVRYEIEKGLFNGTISTKGLDQTWNEMYAKYLGVTVPDARSGILQDVHWAGGSFGYFPTYALGSAFSAQFMHAMRKDLDVDECLRNGQYDVLMGWLKEHIHKYGARYNADEVMRLATGEPFNPDYYLDYLEDKYTKLYNL
ncbi:MAG: carboxypeptidase M32 [Solobacterium sp.]|nr:carboxypeptidase M32 [Solobacterium sp.]